MNKLSGGQRQAMSLLMATIAEPSLLLLDEHTAALDPKVAATIMGLTGEIVTERQLTTLMVTHNMELALRYGDRLVMMHAGRIVLDLSSEQKATLKVGDLIEKFHEVAGEAFAVDRLLSTPESSGGPASAAGRMCRPLREMVECPSVGGLDASMQARHGGRAWLLRVAS